MQILKSTHPDAGAAAAFCAKCQKLSRFDQAHEENGFPSFLVSQSEELFQTLKSTRWGTRVTTTSSCCSFSEREVFCIRVSLGHMSLWTLQLVAHSLQNRWTQWLSPNQTLSRPKFPGACQVRAGWQWWQVQSGISGQRTEEFYNRLFGKATLHCTALPMPSILCRSPRLSNILKPSLLKVHLQLSLDHQDFELTPPRPKLSHTSTSCCSFSDGVYDIVSSSAQDI